MDYSNTGGILQSGGGAAELRDIKASGNERKWKEQKRMSVLLAESYTRLINSGVAEYISKSKGHRVHECASYLEFKRYLETGVLKLHSANLCRARLCPVCASRRSTKVFGQVSKIMDCLEKRGSRAFLFITLTVRNVPGEGLPGELDKLFYGFDRLAKSKEIRHASLGWFRALEITKNWEKNTYHPHFHVVFAVEPGYFKERSYITKTRLWELWRRCMGLGYDPSVCILKVKPEKVQRGNASGHSGEGDITYAGAVSEISKYSVKAADYLAPAKIGGGKKKRERMTDETVMHLDLAMAGRRLLGFGGEFRKLHKELNLRDPEGGDLVNLDGDEELRDDLAYVIEAYQWDYGAGNYFKAPVKPEVGKGGRA